MNKLTAFLIIVLAATVVFAQPVPRRTMPPPLPPMPEPSKKAQKARILREAADALEAEERRAIQELGEDIAKKLHTLDYSNEKFTVVIKSISWMNNDLAQISFERKEKE